MKKLMLTGLLLSAAFCCVSAGDVASFVDYGFSADGKSYVFGQYGKTDKKFQSYAEIYQVDIAENDYVDKGVFITKPSGATAAKTGRETFDALEARNYDYIRALGCEKANEDHVLYLLDDINKAGTDEIEFTDFRGAEVENQDTYRIQLVPSISGTGKNAKSSFFIMLEKRDKDGNPVLTQKIGSPNVVRKGVTNYKIEKIFCDKTEKNLIFVIEKMLEDDTGVSIRYMVEAAKFM